jgi:nucleoside-diphosphate kinase
VVQGIGVAWAHRQQLPVAHLGTGQVAPLVERHGFAEEAGLRVGASRRIHLTAAQAGAFYAEHKERGFYGELCEFMASEPVVVQVLEGEGAILKNREVMGATNPANAAEGTIRKEFALSVGENSVHGSDSEASAAREIAFFFSGLELVG